MDRDALPRAYLASSPLRPPDWRWRSNADCKEGGPIAPVSKTAAGEFRGSLNEWDRCVLESRLLTGAAIWKVARQLQLPSDTVASYQHFFFDVADRLKHRSYVNHCLIGRLSTGESDNEHDLQIAIRNFAYCGGWHVLNAVLAAYSDRISIDAFDDAAMAQIIASRRRKKVREMIEVYLTPVTLSNAEGWAELYTAVLQATEWRYSRSNGARNLVTAMGKLRSMSSDCQRHGEKSLEAEQSHSARRENAKF